MLQSALEQLLLRFLAPYVDGISADKLRLGVLRGSLELDSLTVKAEAPSLLGLEGLRVRRGGIGRLQLKIPWKKLHIGQLRVLVQRVHLEVEPISEALLDGDGPLEDQLIKEIRQAKVRAVEMRLEQMRDLIQQAEERDPKDQGPFVRLLRKILNNIHVDLSEVRITFMTSPGTSFWVEDGSLCRGQPHAAAGAGTHFSGSLHVQHEQLLTAPHEQHTLSKEGARAVDLALSPQVLQLLLGPLPAAAAKSCSKLNLLEEPFWTPPVLFDGCAGIIGCVALSVLFSFPALQRLPSLRQIAGFVWSPSVPTKIERHALAAFHKQMASMLVRLMPGILFFILVRFARIAVARDISFEVAPIDALDIPCLVMYLVGIVLLRFSFLVTPKTLEVWHVLMQCLTILPLLLSTGQACPDSSQNACQASKSLLNLYQFRMISGITRFTLPARMVLSVIGRTSWSVVILNLLHWLVVLSQLPRPAEVGMDGSRFQPTAEMMIIIAAAFAVRHQTYRNVLVSLELRSRSVQRSAVLRLLHGFCDAVVELDAELRIMDARQLAAILLHSRTQQEGRDFVSYFVPEDRKRIRDGLLRPGEDLPALAVNAKMTDSSGTEVNVELLHVQFQEGEDEQRHYVGMREIQSAEPELVAPLQQDLPRAEMSVVFRGDTLQILTADARFCELCAQHLGASSVNNMSLIELAPEQGRESLCGRIQGAINAYLTTRQRRPVSISLQDLKLFGQRVARLSLENDQLLGCLVGELILSNATSQLTASNLTRHEAEVSSTLSRLEEPPMAERNTSSSRVSRRSGTHTSGSSRRSNSHMSGSRSRPGPLYDFRLQL
ncbi:unnamed protein product [Durusdinium trenchii]|uniref:Chorein N-terminal domain-containing protein n=1 Tax=Durusdinium trenchii TaxID=1381693 RepID=A0ABP0LU56_9DINO